jgi:quercetin dioxygenase-like cupin family protein
MTFHRLKTGLQLGAAIAVLGAAAAAHAGDCPADAMRDGARTSGETMPKGVTDNVVGAIPLEEQIGVKDRSLRIRRLVVQPGGVVPWHSHDDRPALIMTLKGSITEYRSTCAVPIEHPAGDVAREVRGVSHWWRNNTKKPAILISADVKDDSPQMASAPDHM